MNPKKLQTTIENGRLMVVDGPVRVSVDANSGHMPVEQACLRHDALLAHEQRDIIRQLVEALRNSTPPKASENKCKDLLQRSAALTAAQPYLEA